MCESLNQILLSSFTFQTRFSTNIEANMYQTV